MASKIILKKSSVIDKIPLDTDLEYGELALNYATGKLFFKNASNTIKSFTIDDSVVTLTGTQTLTNKTLESPVFGGITTSDAGNIVLQPATGILEVMGYVDSADAVNQTFIITVVNDGAGNIFAVDGISKPELNLVRGGVYTFDQSDSSNANHPIAFKDTAYISYTNGVVSTGTPGQAGAQTVFTVPNDAPSDLRYYCTVHGDFMGNTILVSGGLDVVGQIQLNCSENTHGQKIASQPHSLSASNKLTLPGGSIIGDADAVLVSDTGTQTLTNKTISGSSNTLSNIGNDALSNSSFNIGSTNIILGTTSTSISGLISVASTSFDGALTGNASTASTLQTARTIGGVSFNGGSNIDLPGVNIAGNQSTTGNAGSATTLQTARTIGGVSFNGAANINLPGVNIAGNQSTTGNAATATTLQTARTIGGVSFNGAANINLPGVNIAGNQSTTGTAASWTTARTITLAGDLSGSVSIDGATNVTLNASVIGGTGGGTSSNSFATIAVAGQDSVVADSATDTLTLVAGSNITITTDASTDTITIASNGGTGGTASNSFATIAVAGQDSVVADSATDTLTLVAGTGIKITTVAGTDTVTINQDNWSKKTANYTAKNGDRILADTTAATFTVTLPATPTAGDAVVIADAGNWATNNLIVARNGSTIEGTAEDISLDIPGIRVDLVYSGTTWEIYAFTGPAELPPQSGNTGKFLTTNGTVTSWATVDTTESFSFGVGTPASGVEGEIRATNQITAFFSSDARLKENIKNIQDPLHKINMLNGVTYDWTDAYIKTHGGEDGYFIRKHDVGLIAQEVEQVLPEIVAENSEGYKAIKYDRVVALLVEVAKEQQKQIQELREIINGFTK